MNGQTSLDGNRTGCSVQPTGIFILNASGNVIGGATPGAGNVISGNESAGVYIFNGAGASSGNVVEGNLIGLSAGGSTRPGQQRLRHPLSQFAEKSDWPHRTFREPVRPQSDRELPKLSGAAAKTRHSRRRDDQSWLTSSSDASKPKRLKVVGEAPIEIDSVCRPIQKPPSTGGVGSCRLGAGPKK